MRESPIDKDKLVITPPPVNFVMQQGEIVNGVRWQLYVKKTFLNRFKYWMFCRFFPFKIIEWEKEEKL